jgi:phosphatidylglycerophosphate synthase
MFDHLLRLLKDRWLAPLARMIGPRVSPSAISFVAFVLGIAAAFAVYAGRNGVALACWAGNRALDGLDGTHARVHAQQSDFGGYLDIMLDFIVYAVIPLAVALASVDATLLHATAFLLATFFVNAASQMYLAAILEQRQAGARARGEITTITMPPALIAGTETVVIYALFLGVPSWRLPLFLGMGALVCVNILQRLWWARRAL